MEFVKFVAGLLMTFPIGYMRPAVILLIALLSRSAFANTTVRYTISFQGKPAGQQVTSVAADGRISVRFSYRDNGRGPDLAEQIRVAADGTPVFYRVRGKSTFGAPVNETFRIKRGSAQWRSLSDRGQKAVTGPAVYVPIESSCEMTALIARAVARRPKQRIAALPNGELALDRLTETSLRAGERTADIALYGITGVSMQPLFIWLTRQAEPRFFAWVDPGNMRVVDKEWDSQGAALEQMQIRAEGDWLRRLSGRLSHHFADPILFRNVRIFDAQNARVIGPSDVRIANGKIDGIYGPGAAPVGAGAEIDGAGRLLLPALFDMHQHEDPWNSLLQIAGGVTTSRDMGNDNAVLAELRSHIDAGEFLGPRIVPAGFIEGDSPFAARSGIVVKDLQGAKAAVDWYAEHGFRQIKIYNSFRPEWVEPVAAYAHQRKLRVSGHIPAFMTAADAVRAGYDEIQHINQVMLNFFVGPKDDTRTLARFYLIADHAHSLDLSSERVRAFVDLLKEHGTVIDATLATFEAMFTQKQGEVNPSFAAIAPHLPAAQERELRTNSMDVTESNVLKYRASYARMLQFTGNLYHAGIPLVAGTDDIAGFMLHRELELYVKAGIPAPEALRIATWNGAQYTGTLDELGSIEPKKSADVILVDGDPTVDISAIRRVSLVMKSGVVYYPAEIYEAVGVKRFVDPPTLKPGSASKMPHALRFLESWGLRGFAESAGLLVIWRNNG